VGNTLIFPDGVRLTTRDELPGPPDRRDELWARVEAASIHPGYTLKAARDPAFRYYAEANIHAPEIWSAFRDLSRALLGERGMLLLSFKDDDPEQIIEAPVEAMLSAMERHSDQLAHDGYIQFGIVTQLEGGLTEVFVAPSKHFRFWFNDERAFAAQMAKHGLSREQRLEFVDEYPRVTTRLPDERAMQINDLKRELVGRLADTR
jgi:hypothetical protein